MDIILASASPRRKELLEQIGIPFQIKVSDVEEVVTTDVPHLLVQELSAQKARAVLESVEQEGIDHGDGTAQQRTDFLVIGADTVVACDGKILGKPKDAQHAIEMLTMLQGREHQVYTGVTLICRRAAMSDPSGTSAQTASCEEGTNIISKSFYEATTVHFYPMTQEEIEAYVATGDPLDKAGSYGIQGLCARYISGIEGDYNNVVGLPVGRLYQEMKEFS